MKFISESFLFWVSNHFVWVQSILSLLIILFFGFYINIFTSNIITKSTDIIKVVEDLGNWNLLLVAGVLGVIIQTYLSIVPKIIIENFGAQLIDHVLQAATMSLGFHRKDASIRAIVTLLDKSGTTRRTRYYFNTRPDPERTAAFPAEFGVTGEALIHKKVVASELSEDHMDSYTPEIRELILPELKSIIAAPIFLPDTRNLGPIGVLAFDSTEPISKTKFNSRKAKDVVQSWADLLGEILGSTTKELYYYKKK